MKKRYFDTHFKSCPFCGKTRRAGYIVACPECLGFLAELNRHLEGLGNYMERNGYTFRSRITGTNLYLCLRVCVKGYVHTIDSWMTINDIKTSVLPIEEILTTEVCNMCKRLVGKSILW